jgi:hypothetical protein
MMDLAVAQLQRTGLIERTEVRLGTVDDLPPEPSFDAATLIGVLHHLPGDAAKHLSRRDLGFCYERKSGYLRISRSYPRGKTNGRAIRRALGFASIPGPHSIWEVVADERLRCCRHSPCSINIRLRWL